MKPQNKFENPLSDTCLGKNIKFEFTAKFLKRSIHSQNNVA